MLFFPVTIRESENNNPNALSKAIAEIKEMGYRVALPDVNESGTYWQWSERKKAFIPPLTSIKGVGKTAVVEIMQNRPYESVASMLFDDDGKWRHSKLNKTGFASLCQVEAFNGLQEMWDGTIDNHKQLYNIIIDNYSNLKKSKWGMTVRKAKKENAPEILPILIEETRGEEDWGRIDKLTMYQDLCSATRYDRDWETPFTFLKIE